MQELGKKSRRAVTFALERLASKSAFMVPQSIAELKLADRQMVELRLDGDRIVFFSQKGSDHFRSIVQTIWDSDLYTGDADYADIWSACRNIFERSLSRGQLPESAEELTQLLSREIGSEVHNYTYAVAIHGIQLKDVEIMQLGSRSLARSPISFMEIAGISADRQDVIDTVETMGRYKWLIGTARGTRRVSEKRFRATADLACGMLAVAAAVMCSRGAEPFHIGLVLSPEQSHGRAAWLSWTDDSAEAITHQQFLRAQPFIVDQALCDHLATVTTFQRAFKLFESDAPNELEEKIRRSVYWFSDAHRDQNPVMKLVKYWSCIEIFFTTDEKQVTSAVATGIAVVLVFGGFSFASLDEYSALKRRAAKLYGQRSRAVHHGSLEHVSENDVAELSLIAARLIINMLSFVEQGYETISKVKEQTLRLSRAMERREKDRK